MTLGNSPQPPLTRRQLRELGRAQAPEATEEVATEVSTEVNGEPTELEPQLPSAEKTAEKPADKPAGKPSGKSPSKPKASDKPSDQPSEQAAAAPGVALSAKQRRAGTPQPTAAGDTPEITTTFTEIIKPAVVVESVPVSAFAPRGSDPAPVALPVAKTSGKRPAPERTLTRRQLRELKPAEPAESTSEESSEREAVVVATAVDASATGGLNPPVGHWSLDRGDDQHARSITPGQPFDQFMSRGAGASGSPTTTNALILPSIPQQGSSSGPLTATGEILITGSYDLPRSLGSTGHHPSNFDSSDMDMSETDDDGGGYNSTVAPVSASRAVSTHASSRGVLPPPQKRGNTLPGVLAVTAAVLAIGVVTLIVLGYVFHIF